MGKVLTWIYNRYPGLNESAVLEQMIVLDNRWGTKDLHNHRNLVLLMVSGSKAQTSQGKGREGKQLSSLGGGGEE